MFDPDPDLRREAIRALGAVVDDNTLSRLVSLAVELKTAEDLTALEEWRYYGIPAHPQS